MDYDEDQSIELLKKIYPNVQWRIMPLCAVVGGKSGEPFAVKAAAYDGDKRLVVSPVITTCGNVRYAEYCARTCAASEVLRRAGEHYRSLGEEHYEAYLALLRGEDVKPYYDEQDTEEELEQEVDSVESAPTAVAVRADSSAYSRLLQASKDGGWQLDIRPSINLKDGLYQVYCKIGQGNAPAIKDEDINIGCEKACENAIRYCQSVGIKVPDDAPESIWSAPDFTFVGDENIIATLQRGKLFPAVDNSGVPLGLSYLLVEGDFSKLFKGTSPLLATTIGDHKIFGVEMVTSINITRDYTALPVTVTDTEIYLRDWITQVVGNSIELAIRAAERFPKLFLPYYFTGAIVGDRVNAGNVDAKLAMVANTGLRSRFATQTGEQDVVALVGNRCPFAMTTLDLELPLISQRRTAIINPGSFADAMMKRNVVVKPNSTTTTTTVRKANGRESKKMTVTVPKPMKQVTETVVTKRGPVTRAVNTAISGQKFGETIFDYTKTIIDPFGAKDGCKIPDLVIYPSTTFAVHQRFDITADSSGNFAVAAFPWVRQMIQSTNFNNAFSVYDWKNSKKVDAGLLPVIEQGYDALRPVAMGLRATYTGSALNAQGSLVGALTDSAKPFPQAYSDMTMLPEYTEYSISAESAGIEVVWKPMTLYGLTYKNVGQWCTPPGDATTYWPTGYATNGSLVSESAWLKYVVPSGGGTAVATMERNEWPYVIIAGKGLTAGAPLIIEIKIHFEATVSSSTVTLGAVKPSVPSVNSNAMAQAAMAVAQIPSVRKPKTNVLAKVKGIVLGLNDIVREGFNVANTVKEGILGLPRLR